MRSANDTTLLYRPSPTPPHVPKNPKAYLFSFHGVSFVELDDGRALGGVVQVEGDPDALLVAANKRSNSDLYILEVGWFCEAPKVCQPTLNLVK